jgi:hypothetical protein
MMTSAVGPADVSVDRSTLTGQRSRWGCGQWALPASLTPRLTDGPHGSGLGKEKEKGIRLGPGLNLVGPAR